MFTMKELATKIAAISKRNETLRADVQEVLCNIAGHVLQHGDYTKLPTLFTAMHGCDLKAAMLWCGEYSMLNFAKDGSVSLNKSARAKIAKDYIDGDLYVQYLTENAAPWHATAMTPKTAARSLDVASRIESLAKSILTAHKEGRDVKVYNDAIEGAQRSLTAALDVVRVH